MWIAILDWILKQKKDINAVESDISDTRMTRLKGKWSKDPTFVRYVKCSVLDNVHILPTLFLPTT